MPEGEEQTNPDVLTPEPWSRRDDRRVVMALALLFLVGYGLTASYTVLQNHDSRATAMAAWSLGTRGTVALPEPWDESAVSWSRRGVDGEMYVNRFPGPILWGSPFYAVTHLFARGEAPDHPFLIDYRPAGAAAVVLTTLAMLVSYRVLRLVADRRLAVAATLALGFATSVWSISADALWTHGLTHLGLATGVLLLAQKRYARSGLAFGVSILARPQTLVVPAVCGLAETVRLRRISPAVRVGVTSAAGLLLMGLYSHRYFGTWLPIAGYSEGTVRSLATTAGPTFLQRIWLTLVDPTRGLLVYASFLFMLLPGLPRAWRAGPAWVRTSAVSGVLYMLVQLRTNHFSGGVFFFAYRLPLEMLVLGTPLLVLSYRSWVEPRQLLRRSFVVLVLLAVVLQAFGATRLSSSEYVRRFVEPDLRQVCAEPAHDCDADDVLRSPLFG